MKNTILILSLMLLFSVFSKAQINVGKLKDKVKKETTGNQNSGNQSTGNQNANSINNQVNNTNVSDVKLNQREVGGYFHTALKSKDYKSSINIGEELYINFNLNKTMYEFGVANGMDSPFQYGFVVIWINGEKVDVVGPYNFQSNHTKQWTDFSVPLAISPDFIKKIESDQSMLETSQDIWLFQQLFQENGIVKRYTSAAITKMKTGENKLKVEFGLAQSEAKEPKVIICSGEVSIVSDVAGKKELLKKGPKNLIPLEDNEMAKFNFSSSNYTLGSGEYSVTLEMPYAPKYYNMKWCKATSCDYDHGSLNMVAFLNDEVLAFWSVKFENDAYSNGKNFEMPAFISSDKDLANADAAFNKASLAGGTNSLVFGLFDKLYAGKLPEGAHNLRLKLYSNECVPYSATFENTAQYHNAFPAIAENTVQILIKQDVTNKLIASSSVKKLTHDTGEWASVDAHLKTTLAAGMPEIQVLDVATTSQWKVTVNTLGAPIYRDCKADAIYNSSQFGCRLLKGINIREDYKDGKYGKPYSTEVLNSYFMGGSSTLNSMHVPIPISKVK